MRDKNCDRTIISQAAARFDDSRLLVKSTIATEATIVISARVGKYCLV